ncbi:MAG: hypothetical protein KAT75_00845, partial [Dehalococcoidia bacterium]|nr:hypothetical protein [Dehalococcoidia bacterium]
MWYLDNDLDESPGWADHIMYKSPDGEPVNTEDLSVIVGSGAWIIWRADQPALVDVAFGDMPWDGKMMLVEGNSADLGNMVLQLGYIDDAGFTDVGETTLADGDVKPWGAFYDIDVGYGFVVPQGKYLALKVINNSDDAINVRTGSSHAWLRAPPTNPPPPVPELATIVLVAAGLVFVGGYFLLRRQGFHHSSQESRT